MGLHLKQPNNLRLKIPDAQQETFAHFNTLCILKDVNIAEALAELIKPELERNTQLLEGTWLPWKRFSSELTKAGFTFSRTTFWKYRSYDWFGELVKSDGTSTIYHLEGILDFLKRGRSTRMSATSDN